MTPSPDPLRRVGVVIVAYRSASVIQGALLPLPTDRLAEVVVVDNASPDDTADVVAAMGLTGVRVAREDHNRGFGGGCNRGVQELDPGADLILFLNPDAVLSTGSLERLVAYLDEHPGCAMVAPLLHTGDAAIFSAGRDGTLLTELRPLFPKELGVLLPRRRRAPERSRTGPVAYVEGACMLVRRDALAAVGGFDERFFLYFEELDLAHGLRGLGCTVDLCCDARAEHAVATSTSELPLAGRPVLIASTVTYLRKWKGERSVRIYAAAARLSWRLRVRTGDLDVEGARRLRSALDAAVAGQRVTS